MSYYTKITKAGLAAITAAMNNNSKVPITYMAFGDGNGYIPEPDENATSLVNEVYRVGVNKIEVHNKNPNWLVCEAIIPSAVGGFNIREVALYDSTGATMLAIASYPPTYKPTVEEGAAKIQTIRIVIQVDNSGNFELIIDPDVVLATLENVKELQKDKIKQVSSIQNLLLLHPDDGDTVFVQSYHDGWGAELAYRGPVGGGIFTFNRSLSLKNDGGLVINGWVREKNSPYIHPEWFGAKGDGITDDYEALRKCFTCYNSTPTVIENANYKQHTSKSATYFLDSVIYRFTQPLMLPIMSDVVSAGVINYFVEPNILTSNNKPCLFYDGVDIEVAAVYLPLYINNGNGTWSLNTNSLYMASAGDAAERSMAVGCKYRFNIITKRNTKIGFNAYGFESGHAEIGIGTMGTWSSSQVNAAKLQSQDYNYDDLSPRVGIYVRRAWNSKFFRPRIIAHNTGMYIGKNTAKTIVESPYINRQLDKALDAIDLNLDFLPVGIPNEKSFTSAFVLEGADVHLINPVTEHWGVPYTISQSNVTIDKVHIEGSNLIMVHDFVIYNSKITIDDWSGIRTMYGRDGTSVIYSCGMDHYLGHFMVLKGASYYSDNSLYNLVDGTGFDVRYNSYFLSVENIPRDKIMGVLSFADSRYIKNLSGLRDNFYQLYIDPTKTKNYFGVSYDAALKNISQVSEAIRLLGNAWNGLIELRGNVEITQETTINTYGREIEILLANNQLYANGGGFVLKTPKLSFRGTGIVKARNANFLKFSDFNGQIVFGSNVTVDTSNYLCQNVSGNLVIDLFINNSELTAMYGKYLDAGSALGRVGIYVKSPTRPTAYDANPCDGANVVVSSKFIN